VGAGAQGGLVQRGVAYVSLCDPLACGSRYNRCIRVSLCLVKYQIRSNYYSRQVPGLAHVGLLAVQG